MHNLSNGIRYGDGDADGSETVQALDVTYNCSVISRFQN
jgi:hypothetical protein